MRLCLEGEKDSQFHLVLGKQTALTGFHGGETRSVWAICVTQGYLGSGAARGKGKTQLWELQVLSKPSLSTRKQGGVGRGLISEGEGQLEDPQIVDPQIGSYQYVH